MVWYGVVCGDVVWCLCGLVLHGMVGMIPYDTLRRGLIICGVVWYGFAFFFMGFFKVQELWLVNCGG